MTGLYKVRKNVFGKCILQEWSYFPETPYYVAHYKWKDVEWERAPVALVQIKQPIAKQE